MRRPPKPELRAATGTPANPASSKSEVGRRVLRAQEKWHEYLSFLDERMHPRWVFRGQSSKSFVLQPSAGRVQRYDPLFEERVFRAFKKDARLHMHLPETNDWDWLALAQHYGLPTRLLDWSTNPLVACFFALQDERRDKEDAVVFAYPLNQTEMVDPASWPAPFSIERVGFLFPSSLAPRISSQRGLFSVHPRPEVAWESDRLASFTIPVEFRFFFQRKLFRLGVDAAHIWANLEGVCGSLKWQYEKKLGVSAAGL